MAWPTYRLDIPYGILSKVIDNKYHFHMDFIFVALFFCNHPFASSIDLIQFYFIFVHSLTRLRPRCLSIFCTRSFPSHSLTLCMCVAKCNFVSRHFIEIDARSTTHTEREREIEKKASSESAAFAARSDLRKTLNKLQLHLMETIFYLLTSPGCVEYDKRGWDFIFEKGRKIFCCSKLKFP